MLSPKRIVEMIYSKQFNRIRNKLIKCSDKRLSYRKFHSQFGEDRFIYENIDIPDRGVFVDIGAGHPYYESNTYFFEKNGWEGLCIEADPEQFNLLKKHRSNSLWAAISKKEGGIKFYKSYMNAYSSVLSQRFNSILKMTVKDVIEVPSFALETILEDYNIGKIDILDIDVEGSELEVWNSFDYEKHLPRIVIIEYLTFGYLDNYKMIMEHFEKLPYKIIHTTCTNLIFLNTECKNDFC
jgi:FkbM family methyltransferase